MSFNFQFELRPIYLNLQVSFPCSTQIVWKSSQMLSESIQKPPLLQGRAQFDEIIVNRVSLKLDQQTQKFSEKKTSVQIQLFTSKGVKQAGYIILDLAHFANEKMAETQITEFLQKCPDKNSKLTFQLKAIYLDDDESINSSKYSVQIDNSKHISPFQSNKNSLNSSTVHSRIQRQRPQSSHSSFVQESLYLQKKIETEKQNFTQYQSQREIYVEKHQQLQEQIDSNSKLLQQNTYLQYLNSQYQQDQIEMKDQIDQLKQQNTIIQEEYKQIKQEHQQYESANEILRSELSQRTHDIQDEFQIQIDMILKEKEKMQNTFQQDFSNLEFQNQEQQEYINELTTAIEQNQNQIKQMHKQAQDVIQQRNTLQQDQQKMKDKYKAKKNSLKNDKQHISIVLQALQQENNDLQQEIQKQKQTNSSLSQEIQQHIDSQQGLQTKFDLQLVTIEQNQKEIIKLKKDIDELEDQNNEQLDEIMQIQQSQLEKFKQSDSSLRSFKEKNAKLQSQVIKGEAALEELDHLKNQIKDKNQQIQNFEFSKQIQQELVRNLSLHKTQDHVLYQLFQTIEDTLYSDTNQEKYYKILNLEIAKLQKIFLNSINVDSQKYSESEDKQIEDLKQKIEKIKSIVKSGQDKSLLEKINQL